MKKFYSIAVLAMMAVCAMVFTSCGNDDDAEGKKEEDPSITLVVKNTHYLCVNESEVKQAVQLIADFWGNTVAGAGLGTYDKTTQQITIKKSVENKMIAALNAADDSALNTSLAALTNLQNITVELWSSDEITKYGSYYYKQKVVIDTKYLIGTWKAATDSVEYTLTVTDKAAKESNDMTDYYVATATAKQGTETRTYEGVMEAHRTSYKGSFVSNEKISDAHNKLQINFGVKEGSITTEFEGEVLDNEKDIYVETINFKKQ